jgi:hypothetical protein
MAWRTKPPPASRPDILSTAQALDGERAHLRPDAGEGATVEFTALCLSGGGIRSAAFCLGVLQALARDAALTRFDYLSTVSGGGFIGGWLQMLMHEAGGPGAAQAALQTPDPPALHNLRGYTNYLTPQVGLFSADTWTGLALYVRNLLLNWLVLGPVFILMVLTLVFHRTAVAAFGQMGWSIWGALAVGQALLLVAVYQVCLLLPSHRPLEPGTAPTPHYASTTMIRRTILAPAVGWSLLVPVTIRGLDDVSQMPLLLSAVYFVTMSAAYAAATARQRRSPEMVALYRGNFAAWLVATCCACLTFWCAGRLYQGLSHKDAAAALTIFAPLVLILCHLLQIVIHVGLRRETGLPDLDREWLARISGLVLRLILGWTVFALCCLSLSTLLLAAEDGSTRTSWVTAGVSLATGPVAAWLGKQALSRVGPALTGPGAQKLPLRQLLNLLAVVFAIALFAALGALVQYCLGWTQIRIFAAWHPGVRGLLLVLGLQIVVGLVLFFVTWGCGRVNVNRFSMHGVYRNRLSRAFLGSALRDRMPDPFTGFGTRENPPLAEFATTPVAPGERGLFHVINIALNMTQVTHTAWAERKATSFTATPLACGAATLHNPNGQPVGAPTGAYVRTTHFAGAETQADVAGCKRGTGLGTMLTISGAAVSPNWGYNSSPLTAFLMTLFNVRLGAWAPNPAVATQAELCLARPRNSHLAILRELIGSTTDTSQSLYLSDGGHFDNLGLYEMLRRKCAKIVVIDAGQDQDCAFFDLGNAIRKASIDQLASVEMDHMSIYPRSLLELQAQIAATALGVATGSIRYPDGSLGQLVYIKPSYLPAIPAEIRSYGASHPDFPHESTAEQWFTESQFESYRALGSFQAGLLTQHDPGAIADPLDRLFTRARAMTVPPSPANVACNGGT